VYGARDKGKRKKLPRLTPEGERRLKHLKGKRGEGRDHPVGQETSCRRCCRGQEGHGRTQEDGGGFLFPFRYIFKEKGIVLMIGVALLWSIAATMDKLAVISSDPYFYVMVINTGFLIYICSLL